MVKEWFKDSCDYIDFEYKVVGMVKLLNKLKTYLDQKTLPLKKTLFYF